MIAILGSGFGLYGYLPAAVGLELGPILLPKRYQETFSLRQELQPFSENIKWIDSEQDLINMATTIVISRRPIDQFELLPNLLKQPNLKNLILEKPFATNPAQAFVMQQQIETSNKKCAVGFIFCYLPWAIALKKHLLIAPNLSTPVWKLKWQFMAHHYINQTLNWKRDHTQGGGVIRFYGIHIIALLAEWGYDEVVASKVFIGSRDVGASKWEASFKGQNLPNFDVEIDSQSKEQSFSFELVHSDQPFYRSGNPFESQISTNLSPPIDIRCKYLKKLLLENQSQIEVWPNRLVNTLQLWQRVEKATNFSGSKIGTSQ